MSSPKLTRQTANEAADAIIAEHTAPFRARRRLRLLKSYSVTFGWDYADRCAANPHAADLALQRASNGAWFIAARASSFLIVLALLIYSDSNWERAAVFGGTFFGSAIYGIALRNSARNHFDELAPPQIGDKNL